MHKKLSLSLFSNLPQQFTNMLLSLITKPRLSVFIYSHLGRTAPPDLPQTLKSYLQVDWFLSATPSVDSLTLTLVHFRNTETHIWFRAFTLPVSFNLTSVHSFSNFTTLNACLHVSFTLKTFYLRL